MLQFFKFHIELKEGKHNVNNLKFFINVTWHIFYFKEFYLVKDIIKGWNCNQYFRNARKVPFSIFHRVAIIWHHGIREK